MKKIITCLVLLFVLFGFSSFIFPNTFYRFEIPGHIDNSDYTLNIIEANIVPLKDTIFGRNKCFIATCPLTLTNNSNDTLKYAGMSASWRDYYTLNNKNFSLAADYWNVFKNGQVMCVLPPHQSRTKNIRIITYKDYFRGEKLRIAMRLQKVARLPIVDDVTSISANSNFLI